MEDKNYVWVEAKKWRQSMTMWFAGVLMVLGTVIQYLDGAGSLLSPYLGKWAGIVTVGIGVANVLLRLRTVAPIHREPPAPASKQGGFVQAQILIGLTILLAGAVATWFLLAAPRLRAERAQTELVQLDLKRSNERISGLTEDLKSAKLDIQEAQAASVRRDLILIAASGRKDEINKELENARVKLKNEIASGPLADCLGMPVGALRDRMRNAPAKAPITARR